jgi:hypothetical protein
MFLIMLCESFVMLVSPLCVVSSVEIQFSRKTEFIRAVNDCPLQ